MAIKKNYIFLLLLMGIFVVCNAMDKGKGAQICVAPDEVAHSSDESQDEGRSGSSASSRKCKAMHSAAKRDELFSSPTELQGTGQQGILPRPPAMIPVMPALVPIKRRKVGPRKRRNEEIFTQGFGAGPSVQQQQTHLPLPPLFPMPESLSPRRRGGRHYQQPVLALIACRWHHEKRKYCPCSFATRQEEREHMLSEHNLITAEEPITALFDYDHVDFGWVDTPVIEGGYFEDEITWYQDPVEEGDNTEYGDALPDWFDSNDNGE